MHTCIGKALSDFITSSDIVLEKQVQYLKDHRLAKGPSDFNFEPVQYYGKPIHAYSLDELQTCQLTFQE